MNNRFKLILINGWGIGIGTHNIRAKVIARMGAVTNRNRDDVIGRIGSFVNNFTASAIGWRRPKDPTIFGPLRSCM